VFLGSKSASNSPGSAPAVDISSAVEGWVNAALSINSREAPLNGFVVSD